MPIASGHNHTGLSGDFKCRFPRVFMKHELSLVVILSVLLILRIRNSEWKNDSVIRFMNTMLVLNFAFGFIMNMPGTLFGGMYHTNPLLAFEKNILNFGTLIICLQSSAWMKNHKHLPEFYMLLISTLIGMFLMLSSGNLLMIILIAASLEIGFSRSKLQRAASGIAESSSAR